MSFRFWLISIALALPLSAIAAECEAPQPPAWIPDGDKATKEEMLEGQELIKDYVDKAQAYVECIDANEQKALQGMANMDEKEREAGMARLNQKRKERNEVVEQMQNIAEQFNKELKKYRERLQQDEN